MFICLYLFLLKCYQVFMLFGTTTERQVIWRFCKKIKQQDPSPVTNVELCCTWMSAGRRQPYLCFHITYGCTNLRRQSAGLQSAVNFKKYGGNGERNDRQQ